jgi:hypothetical protein
VGGRLGVVERLEVNEWEGVIERIGVNEREDVNEQPAADRLATGTVA